MPDEPQILPSTTWRPRAMLPIIVNAQGGSVDLIITEGIRVHPTSLRRLGLAGCSDAVIAALAAVVRAVHDEKARILAQLLHAGQHDGDEWTGISGPSAIPWTVGADIPHQVTVDEVQTVTASFMATAARMATAGFDGGGSTFGARALVATISFSRDQWV